MSRLAAGARVDAVLFDLDDTLFPQERWLSGAWDAVADAAADAGAPRASVLDALRRVAAEGSANGRIIDRALAQVRCSHIPVEPLVEAFRSHAPPRLEPFPGLDAALDLLHAVPLGIVTDGDPTIQWAKLRALGFLDRFDHVVVSDTFGRRYRKPHALPFRVALLGLGADTEGTVHVGDNPAKDVAGALRVGCRAVRVRTGEHAHRPDDPEPWASFADVVSAIEHLAPLARGQVRRSACR